MVALFVLVAPGLGAQSLSRPVVGDSVRFDLLTSIGDADAVASVARQRQAGRLVGLGSDALTIQQGDATRELPLSRLSDVRVWREVSNPALRGFRRGAVVGGAVIGTAAFALALCNPAILGDGGCTGPDSASEVASFALVGAVIGALPAGLLGALLASSHEWHAVELSVGAAPTAAQSALTLRLQVGPRPGLRADLYLGSL
jgi:hypothetical protein